MKNSWLVACILMVLLPSTLVYGQGLGGETAKSTSTNQVTVKIKSPSPSAINVEDTVAPGGSPLIVETLPAGAEVTVNGIKKGASPVVVSDLTPGPITIQIHLDSYQSITRTITAEAGKQKKMSVLLEREAGSGQKVGNVIKLTGRALFKSINSTQSAPLRLGLKLYEGDEVTTEGDGNIRILFDDESVVCVAESTRLIISEYRTDMKRKLRSGWMTVQIGKAGFFINELFKGFKGPSFRVQTTTAIMGVRGTAFIVWAKTGSTTSVVCLEHKIELINVDRPYDAVVLGPNMASDVLVSRPPSVPTAAAPAQLKEFQAGLDSQATSLKDILSELSPVDEKLQKEDRPDKEKEWLRMFHK
ncbi:MAG: PEGA domain-containing protein [Deltaproteobacteria bacterium]|nr:PEGA domain-containing protein [Deltaproteobacteria bacterium]